MPDPIITAAREVLDESLDELRKAIVGLDADDLNRPPLSTEANSLAVLVVHALASTRMWVSLATAADVPPRDRDEEFRTVVTDPAAFLTDFDATATAARALLQPETVFEPALLTSPPGRRAEEGPVTAGWALLHALSHINEHVGHAQLTRQRADAGTSDTR